MDVEEILLPIMPRKLRGKYIFDERKGSGGYGQVFTMKNRLSSGVVALKLTPYDTPTLTRQKARDEISLCLRMRHDNIVHVLEAFDDAELGRAVIVMENFPEDLSARIKRHREHLGPFAERDIITISCQITRAIRYLHSQRVMHRDIKPANVLIDGLRVKITDFGISKHLPNDDIARTLLATRSHVAPELCRGGPYTAKVDLWELGVILFELVTLDLPYSEATIFARYPPEESECPPMPQPYSFTLKSIVRVLLRLDPTERPSADQLLTIPELHNAGWAIDLRKREEEIAGKERLANQRMFDADRKHAHLDALDRQVAARDQRALERQHELDEGFRRLDLARYAPSPAPPPPMALYAGPSYALPPTPYDHSTLRPALKRQASEEDLREGDEKRQRDRRWKGADEVPVSIVREEEVVPVPPVKKVGLIRGAVHSVGHLLIKF